MLSNCKFATWLLKCLATLSGTTCVYMFDVVVAMATMPAKLFDGWFQHLEDMLCCVSVSVGVL